MIASWFLNPLLIIVAFLVFIFRGVCMYAGEHISHAHTQRSEGTSQGEVPPFPFSGSSLCFYSAYSRLAHKFLGISPLSISHRSSRATDVCRWIRLLPRSSSYI